jgi:phage FluMu gp28-like protein
MRARYLQFTQVHEVQARSSAATGATGSNGSLANADAFIAMGSDAVEEVRMIKGNDGTTLDL